MKYLILCDMDGTLLNNKGEVSQYTIDTISKLSKNHNFCLVTSNSYEHTYPIYKQLGLNTYLACDNGGTIINPNDMLCDKHSFSINNEYIKEIFTDLKENITSMFYKSNNIAFGYNYLPSYNVLMNMPSNTTFYQGDFIDLPLIDTTNLYLITTPDKQDFIQDYFSNKKIKVDFIGSDKKRAIFNITHPKSSKAYSVELFKGFYNYDKVISFGDTLNDVEMLKKTDLPFLMKNSNVKNTNFNITEKTNNEDGVAFELNKIIK